MKQFISFLALAAQLTGALANPETAVTEAKPTPTKPAKKTDDKKSETDAPVVREHTLTIDGKKIAYQSSAGFLPLLKDDGKERASIFHIAYTRTDVKDPGNRPITFCFNGGPGSSSVWLHMGVFGPKKVVLNELGGPAPPPARYVDNPSSLLDKTDLVFIDPVSTGYSRAAAKESAKQFHSLEGDISSVAEFIRLYVTRNNRWGSPKFLAGESYGTTRAAGLSSELRSKHGMHVNGLMLVSSVLEFQTIRPGRGNDLPYALFFPSYAASAWYHKQLQGSLGRDSLEDLLRKAEAFAMDTYLPALYAGNTLTEKDASRIADQAAALTGTEPDLWADNNLRLSMSQFNRALLREDQRSLGRMDSRLTIAEARKHGDYPFTDPALDGWIGPYTSAFNQYLRQDLGVERDEPYRILSRKVHPWSYDSFENSYVDVASRLRSSMMHNQSLHVYVASGYYDLATPYFATDFTLRRMELLQGVHDRIHVHYYEAGHMMYVIESGLKKMKKDLAEFVDQALGQ